MQRFDFIMPTILQFPNGFHKRDPLIISYCTGRTVMHLGCIGETDGSLNDKIKKREKLLHFKVSNIAKELYGVDLDQDVILRYQNELNVPNLFVGNVEQLDKIEIKTPFKAFDVILFCDLLEHLSNPDAALNGLKRFINENSIILISVPHAFGVLNFIRYTLDIFQEGNQHVAMYNIAGLQNLLERHGYRIVNYFTCYEKRLNTVAQKIIFYIPYIFLKMFPKFGGSILIEAKLNTQ